MEEIMAKINSLEFTNEENLKEIIENIMELEESKEDALKEFIKKIYSKNGKQTCFPFLILYNLF